MEQLGPLGRIGCHCCRCPDSLFPHRVSLLHKMYSMHLTNVYPSCISSRRRRKAGRKPFYGTGWAGAKPWGGQAQYNPNYQTQQPQYGQQAGYGQNYNQGTYAPPNYNQSTGGYGQQGGAAQSYFGGQRGDVEMNNSSGYAPPPGPPPGKSDVVR